MQIADDKKKHFLGSAILAIVFGLIFTPIIGAIISISIGILKEIYDKISGTGTADFYDIVADAAGVVTGTFVVLGINLL